MFPGPTALRPPFRIARPLRRLAIAAACLGLAGPAAADVALQHAGPCDAVAPVAEDPTLHWDYWWSGRCEAGLASGPGFLVQSMRGGGFGDVYAARMVQGRMAGELRIWGPRFLGAEWNLRTARAGDDGEPVDDTPDAGPRLSRFGLPLALQQALDRFAADVGHPQMPALPVPAEPLPCPAFVDGEGRPGMQGPGTAVGAFIASHGGAEAARREVLLQALEADAARGTGRGSPPEARRQLALAAAVAGCAASAAP